MNGEYPAPALNVELIARLRHDLLAADWTVETVGQILGPVASAALAREQRVPAIVRLEDESSPAAQLTKAFILGIKTDLAAALPTLGLDGAEELGIIDGQQNPLIDLRPHGAQLPSGSYQWWVASDRCEMQTGRPLRPDHVLGIGPATLSLLRMTVRNPVGSALDLGTGCGIQALYLSTHSRSVVATDVSARACAYARFNSSLNEAGIDVRQGSLFDPVRDEHFDLITSNPPFVITPPGARGQETMDYRDAGMDRDDLVSLVVKDGPSHLRGGGLLQMLLNWEHPVDQEEWPAPVRRWLAAAQQQIAPAGLDAWLVQRDALDTAQYSEMWLRDAGGTLLGRERWEDDFKKWVDGFAKTRTQQIGMGFLAVRATSGDALRFHADEVLEGDFPDGETVLAALDNLVLPPDWKERSLIRAADVREKRHYVPGQPDPQIVELTQGAGMGRTIRVGTTTSALVGTADGELSISQVVGAISSLTDKPARAVWEEVATSLPQLLRTGMVRFWR